MIGIILNGNIKMAIAAIRTSKWRSLMTMFGIIIGVVSVVTTLSLGEGVKRQLIGQINQLGSDLITVRPGKTSDLDRGNIANINIFAGFGAGTLVANDLKIIQQTPNVRVAVPFGLVTGIASVGGTDMDNAAIIATTEGLPEIINQKIEYGGFFKADDASRPVAVIGKHVAEQLFRENVPTGKTLTIRGKEFIVRGVFEEFETMPLSIGSDFNTAIFIPYNVGKQISNEVLNISQILVKPTDTEVIQPTISLMHEALLNAHAGQEDFTILKQSESLKVTTNMLDIIAAMIAGIAAISLLVAGIGIMNIMLVSVTERTPEIGIRKAIGATNHQILMQFLVEATLLSFLGGLVGIALAGLTNFGIRIFTNLQPVITWPMVLIACGVTILVGVVFGIAPALKAARKDPIEALRH